MGRLYGLGFMWGSLGTHLLWHGLDRPGRAIWIGLSVSFIWIVVGVLLVGLAGTLFVQNREPVASTATPES